VAAAFPVWTFARFVAPGLDPASIEYVTTGSPDAGAFHVRVTELPATLAWRAAGDPGAVAPAAAGASRAAEKQSACAKPPRHAEKFGTVGTIDPKTAGATGTEDGETAPSLHDVRIRTLAAMAEK
jgi:hypothetical protein